MSSDGNEPSIFATLSEALELVEALVEEGHVNAHAHIQIAAALQRVNDVETSEKKVVVRDAVVKLVAESGFVLGPVMWSEVGDLSEVFGTEFLRKLFHQRVNIEPKPCTAFNPEWVEGVLQFYVPPPHEGERCLDLCMQREMMLTLLRATPDGISITNDLIKHLDRLNIQPGMLVSTNVDDAFEYDNTNWWIQDLLECAPEMLRWAAPDSDMSVWAAGQRLYARSARDARM